MEKVSNETKMESIESLQSTIRKCEKALAQMSEKGANTTLVKKRLKALCVGLAILENLWNERSHQYSQEDLIEGLDLLSGLIPSIMKSYAKAKEASPQKTLLKRRIKALELAVQAIEDFLNNNFAL